MYAPPTGRWLSEDPAGYVDGPNQYLYVRNNPVNFADPSGMQHVDPGGPMGPKPPFPKKGDACVTGDNLESVLGFPLCCTVTPKPKRITPFPAGTTSPAENNFVVGGKNKFCPPGTQLGSHGMGPCIGVVIQCPDGVAAFHFQAPESPYRNILRYDWPAGCKAIVCGGEDEWYSNCLAKEVMEALEMRDIPVVGVTGADTCGAKGDGTWYHT